LPFIRKLLGMPSLPLPGEPLGQADVQSLARCGINPDQIERALLRRVDSATGAEIICRNGSGHDYSGIAIPYLWPGNDRVRDYRLRLDNPELEYSHGALKAKGKYLSAIGRAPLLYFAPDTPVELLDDPTLMMILTEGEKKTLALHQLGRHGLGDSAEQPRWLAGGIPGVWSWRGKRGRTEGANGQWVDVKGPIPDFDRITWLSRRVIILFDSNVHSNVEVRRARRHLADELRERGASIFFVDIPADAGVNGVDDLIGIWGSDRVLALITEKPYDPRTIEKRFVLTEIGNAERFVEMFGGEARFCHQSSQWLVWDETRFAPDQNAAVERYAKATIRQLFTDGLNIADKERREATIKFALRSDSDHGIRALLNRAAAEEGVPVLLNDLDADPWLLNVANGTVDLRTGQLRPHDRGDCISKLAPVRLDPAAKCPRWMHFLDEVFAPHPDAIEYLQRAVGYSLSADISEECLFMLHGTGRNGKGTLLKTLQAALGDYASTADFSTFIATRDDRGPRDDVANMRGRRLVISQEVREGAALAESLVKWLTGGDVVRARNLYERSSEWTPTHHIWLAVNRLPVVRGTDAGIWSRIRLIPFDVSFEGHEDKQLKHRLTTELPGILNWCIEGCLMWQRDGLGTSAAVQAATSAYKVESDQVARFIDDECVTLLTAQVGARKLYSAYKYWADRGGEDVLSETAFGLTLSERGFEKKPGRNGIVYFKIGIRAKTNDQRGEL
jgi:putative DNA primase/helicase